MSNDQIKKLGLLDIRKGSTLDYDFTNWKAIEEHNYYWGEDTYSRLFTLRAKGKTIYLEIEDEEEEMGLAVFEKISLHKISQNFPHFHQEGKIPEILNYHQQSYYFVSENEGKWRDRGEGGDWENFTVWDYADETGEFLLSVELWEDNEWEAFAGKKIEESQVSNITRPKKRASSSNSWLSQNIGWVAVLGFFGLQFLFCNTCDTNNRGTSNSLYSQSFTPAVEGINEVIQQYDYLADFTILLQDMDYRNDRFLHKYEVIIPEGDSIRSEITDWKSVSGKLFNQQKDHLGLELVSKKDGMITREVAPPGFSEYVGNEQYGEWREENGSRNWYFFPRYYFMRNIFYRNYSRPSYSAWNNYNTQGRGRSGYFSNNSTYNTSRFLQTNGGQSSRWANLSPSLRQQLQKGPVYNEGGGSSRRSRSGSRYSNSSNRSRSGGFGK